MTKMQIALIAARPRSAVMILVALTVAKICLFVALNGMGRVAPFPGDNYRSHQLPVAQRMLAEQRFNGPDSRPDSKVPPGYPAMIAGAIAVAGNGSLMLLALLQFVADLGIGVAIYLWARGIGAALAGLATAIAWQIYPPETMISTWITPETVFTLFLVTGVIAMFATLRGAGLRPAVVAGLLLGIGTMFRGTTVILPLALLPMFLYLRQFRIWLTLSAAMALVIVPWTIRNWVVLHDFIPVSVGIGSVTLQGSDERFFAGSTKADFYTVVFQEAAVAGIHKPQSDHESGIDGWMGKVGVWVTKRRLHERPLSMLPFLAHKTLRLFYGTESAAPKTELALGFFSLLVVPAGLWQWWRWRRRATALVLFGVLGCFFLLHIATLPQIRYVLPTYPFLLFGACHWYLQKLGFSLKADLA